MAEMAAARGEADLAAQARALEAKARGSIESRYWIEGAAHHAFGVLRSGRTNDTLDRVAGHGGGLRPPRARSRPPHARGALDARADRRLGGADADDREPPLRPHPLQHGRGVALRDRLRGPRPLPVRAAVGGVPARERARRTWPSTGRAGGTRSCSRAPTTGRSTPPSRTSSSRRRCSRARSRTASSGWDPDAPAGRARLAPQLPPQWESARVSGLRVGQARLDVDDRAGPGSPLAAARAPGRAVLARRAARRGPPERGTRAVFVDGRRVEASEGGGAVVALDGRARVVEARWTGGLAVEAPLAAARARAGRPGRAGARLRGDARGLEAPARGAGRRLGGRAACTARPRPRPRARRCGPRARGPRRRCPSRRPRRGPSRRPRFACSAPGPAASTRLDPPRDPMLRCPANCARPRI